MHRSQNGHPCMKNMKQMNALVFKVLSKNIKRKNKVYKKNVSASSKCESMRNSIRTVNLSAVLTKREEDRWQAL